MKVSLLPLNDLYARSKITASVEAAIQEKEDFSRISPTYCDKVCRLKCKNYDKVNLQSLPVDILIVQDHSAPRGKWDRRDGQQEEIQQGIIQLICKKAGFDGLTYRVTNLLKCGPTEEDFPRGKAPTATTLLKCKPYLLGEIARLKPRVIISLSTAVTKALGLKKHSNTGNRGEIVGNGPYDVVITLHPRVLTFIRQNASGSMWGADYFNIIVRDFSKAARIARGELKIPNMQEAISFYVKNRMTFARSLDDVKAIMAKIEALPENSIISVDTETTGLDPYSKDAKLLLIQMGYRDPKTRNIVAVVIPLWHRKNKYYDPDAAWDLVVPFLMGPRKKVFHNGKFDVIYIAVTKGVRVQNFALDTMLLAHDIDSGTQGCYSLKTMVWDVAPDLGIAGWETLLPGLTKQKKGEEQETEDEESEVEYD